MNEVITRLNEILDKLNRAQPMNIEILIDVKNKLSLYIQKYFQSRKEYIHILQEIETKPGGQITYNNSLAELKSLTNTLIQDIQLSDNDFNFLTEKEKSKIINETRKEIESEREKIKIHAKEIEALRNIIEKERKELISEGKKFNEFKTKLEIADKELDFLIEAANNKKTAIIWASLAAILIIILIKVLSNNLDTNNILLNMAEDIKQRLQGPGAKIDTLITTTIYFTFSKFILTKILLYSLIIYAITFCTKNYAAQMHNHTINVHKSNAFKSTLSLLNTAKSADGNDKLLIQATQAIFSHQHTGYNGKESEPTSPNVITNVIDAAAKNL